MTIYPNNTGKRASDNGTDISTPTLTGVGTETGDEPAEDRMRGDPGSGRRLRLSQQPERLLVASNHEGDDDRRERDGNEGA